MKRIIGLVITVLFVSVLIVSFCLAAAGNTYYVDTNGNDANPGTISQPWKTIHKAAAVAVAGDTVYIRGGTYYLTTRVFICGKGGAAGAPIIFSSYPGERAVVDGSQNTSAEPDNFAIEGAYFYELRNLDIVYSKRIGISTFGGSHDLVISGCVIRDSYKGALCTGLGASNIVFDNNIVYHNVQDNNNHQYRDDGGWYSAVNIEGTNNRITNCQIYENWGEGIGFYGNGHYVANNILHDNYSVDIYASNLANSVCDRNFIYSNNDSRFFRFNTPANALQLSNEGAGGVQFDNNKFINNIIIGPHNWAIMQWNGSGAGLKNSVIANNTVVAHGLAGLFRMDAGPHSNTIIANNIFYQTNSGARNTEFFTTAGLTFSNNCWYGGNPAFPIQGTGPGDINADPKVVNKDGMNVTDFKLTAFSPCLNAGCTLSAVTKDFWDVSRPYGPAFDIGAHEYGGAPAPTPTPTATLTPTATPTATATPGITPVPTPTLSPSGIKVQFYGETDNNQKTVFKVKLLNTSGSPKSNLSFRVYYSPDNGSTGYQYALSENWDPSGVFTISGPVYAYGSQFFFTVSGGTNSLAANGSWEVSLTLHLSDWSTNYNGGNDWYHTGYAVGALPSSYTETGYIPAYENGGRVWGMEPSENPSTPTPSVSPTASPTSTSTSSVTPVASATPSFAATPTATPTATVTTSSSPVIATPTPTATPTASVTPTVTVSATISLQPTPSPGTNLALNKTASADATQYGGSPSYANDGNNSSKWDTGDNNFPHWWKVDLGGSYSISRTEVMWTETNSAYKYKIEVSGDNTNWTVKVDKTNNTTRTQTNIDYFTATARYVRITVTGSSDWYAGVKINEFRVY